MAHSCCTAEQKKQQSFSPVALGIPLFISIVRQAAYEKDPHKMYLFYSNRRPEDAPFLDVLEEAEKQNRNFHTIATMVEMDKSQREWHGETGFIHKEMLSRHLPQLPGPIYYLAGPPSMVAAMRKMLIEAGVDEDDIRTEEFSGY